MPVIECINGAQKCSSGVVVVCVYIVIAFITSRVMKFGSVFLVGVRSVGVECHMDFVLLVLSRFYRLGGGIECVLGNSPSEVVMVTPSEGCVNGIFY